MSIDSAYPSSSNLQQLMSTKNTMFCLMTLITEEPMLKSALAVMLEMEPLWAIHGTLVQRKRNQHGHGCSRLEGLQSES